MRMGDFLTATCRRHVVVEVLMVAALCAAADCQGPQGSVAQDRAALEALYRVTKRPRLGPTTPGGWVKGHSDRGSASPTNAAGRVTRVELSVGGVEAVRGPGSG